MSQAYKCDRCKVLYEPMKGCITVEQFQVKEGRGETWALWEGFDLCLNCSGIVRKTLGRAMSVGRKNGS